MVRFRACWRGTTARNRSPPNGCHCSTPAYRGTFAAYLEALGAAGVRVVPSRLESTLAADGRIAGWCLQPLLDPKALATEQLKTANEDASRRLISQIADRILAAVGTRLGLDGRPVVSRRAEPDLAARAGLARRLVDL